MPLGDSPYGPLLNTSGGSYTLARFQPRLEPTYTLDANDVLRGSFGVYARPPNAGVSQYNTLQADLPAFLGAHFYGYGFNTPDHLIRPDTSYNYDVSWEHHVKGTDWSFKLSPFFRATRDQLQNFYIDPQGGLKSGLNVGSQQSSGIEFALQKGNFSRDGLSGQLAFTYTHSLRRRRRRARLPTGEPHSPSSSEQKTLCCSDPAASARLTWRSHSVTRRRNRGSKQDSFPPLISCCNWPQPIDTIVSRNTSDARSKRRSSSSSMNLVICRFATSASHFFQVIAQRYEHSSVFVTGNLPCEASPPSAPMLYWTESSPRAIDTWQHFRRSTKVNEDGSGLHCENSVMTKRKVRLLTIEDRFSREGLALEPDCSPRQVNALSVYARRYCGGCAAIPRAFALITVRRTLPAQCCSGRSITTCSCTSSIRGKAHTRTFR